MFANKPEFLSTTQDAQEVLTELPALADALFRVFQGRYGLLCTIVTVFLISWYFLFKANPNGLIAYYQTRRRSRFEALEKYLSNIEARDQNCAQAIRDIYEAECFEQATGIYAERTKRAALISLYNKVNDVASWRTIRTAENFLLFDEPGIATIRPLNKRDRISYLSHTIFGNATIVIGALIFFMLPFLPGNRLLGFIEGFGAFFLLLVLGCLSLRERGPYECAKKIRARLEFHPGSAEPGPSVAGAAADPAAGLASA